MECIIISIIIIIAHTSYKHIGKYRPSLCRYNTIPRVISLHPTFAEALTEMGPVGDPQ